MLVAVSDTHSTDGHRLRGRTLDAVREADRVIHAGDFYTESVLDDFESVSGTLYGVTGNNDDAGIRDRLPESRVVSYAGVTFAVRHRSRSGATGLALFGREHGADAVIFGHSHKPTVDDSAAIPLVNPGSHAQPRGNRPAHAEFEPLRVADAVSGDDAVGDDAVGDDAVGNGAVGDDAVGNDAVGNGAVGDDAVGADAVGADAVSGDGTVGDGAVGDSAGVVGRLVTPDGEVFEEFTIRPTTE
jgi:hypothetical protein